MKYEDVNSPEELLSFMESIQYGFESDGTFYLESEEHNKNISKWRLSSPNRLLETKVGNCFDQVELERDWFFKHNYQFKTIFLGFKIEEENNCPMHAFLAYEENGEWYHFENADGLNRGIHKFNSFDELLENVKSKLYEYAKINNPSLDAKIGAFLYNNPRYGVNLGEFLTDIVDSRIDAIEI